MFADTKLYKMTESDDLRNWQRQLRYKITRTSDNFIWVEEVSESNDYQYRIAKKEFDTYLEIAE